MKLLTSGIAPTAGAVLASVQRLQTPGELMTYPSKHWTLETYLLARRMMLILGTLIERGDYKSELWKEQTRLRLETEIYEARVKSHKRSTYDGEVKIDPIGGDL